MVDFKVEGKASLDPARIIEDVDMIIERLDRLVATVDRVDAAIDRVSGKRIDIGVNIDGEDKLVFLRQLVDDLDSRVYVVNLEVDVRGRDKIDELSLKIDELDAKKHQVDIEVDLKGAVGSIAQLELLDRELQNKQKDLKDTSSAVKGFQFSWMTLLPILTAAIPVLLAAGAGIIALAGAAAVVAPGLIGIMLAAKPAFTAIQQLTKALDANTKQALSATGSYQTIYDLLNKNSKQFRGMSAELQDLTVKWFQFQNSYTNFQKAVDPAVFAMLGSGLELLRTLLSGLPAIVIPAAAAIQNFLIDFTNRLHDPVFKAFFNDMKTNMYTLVTDWATGILNIIEGLLALFHAFMPVSLDISGGFLRMTASFNKWAQSLSQSKGFQQFVAYVEREGPIALHVIGQLVLIIGKIVGALMGMGGGALSVIDKVVTGINHFADTNPGLFKVAANLLLIGFAASKLWPLLAPLVAFLATPVGAVVGVVVALAAGFIYLYEKSSAFREYVKKNLEPMWNELVKSGQGFVNWAKSLWPEIQKIWQKYGKQIEAIVKDLWNAVVNVIKGAITIIKGIVDVFLGLLSGHWGQVWKGLGEIVGGAWRIIQTLVSNFAKIVLNLLEIFGKAVWSLITAAWDTAVKNIKSRFDTAVKYVKNFADNVIHDLDQWGKDIAHTVSTAIDGVVKFFRDLPGKIEKIFANAASWLFDAGTNIVQGLLNGLKALMGDLLKVAGQIGDIVSKGVQQALKNNSPSRVMFGHGVNAGLGLIDGLESQHGALKTASDKLGKTIESSFGKKYTTDISSKVKASIADANFAASSFGRGGKLPQAQGTQVNFAANSIVVHNARAEPAGTTLTRVMQGVSKMGTIQAPTGFSTSTG